MKKIYGLTALGVIALGVLSLFFYQRDARTFREHEEVKALVSEKKIFSRGRKELKVEYQDKNYNVEATGRLYNNTSPGDSVLLYYNRDLNILMDPGRRYKELLYLSIGCFIAAAYLLYKTIVSD